MHAAFVAISKVCKTPRNSRHCIFFALCAVSSLNLSESLINCIEHVERMQSAGDMAATEQLSESRRLALLKLLGDEDPAVYHTVREKILSCGPSAAEWLRPHTLSRDPALRRRAQELVLRFDRQVADNRFLAFCLQQGEECDLEIGRASCRERV